MWKSGAGFTFLYRRGEWKLWEQPSSIHALSCSYEGSPGAGPAPAEVSICYICIVPFSHLFLQGRHRAHNTILCHAGNSPAEHSVLIYNILQSTSTHLATQGNSTQWYQGKGKTGNSSWKHIQNVQVLKAMVHTRNLWKWCTAKRAFYERDLGHGWLFYDDPG